MQIAYLLDQYPAISHSFILREVAGLRERGWGVQTLSIHRSDLAHLLAQADTVEYGRTFALRPISPIALASRHLRGFRTDPSAYLRTLVLSLRLGRAAPRHVLWQLFYFLEAVPLWLEIRARGIVHVHAHFTRPAADVALLVASLGGGDASGWSWSFSAHGSDIVETDQQSLAEKVRRATGVVCVSDFGRSQLLTLVDQEHWPKIVVVHCGLDPAPSAPRVSRSTEGTSVNLLNVGRMVRLKGQGVLLEAVALLRRRGVAARLTIVGDGPLRDELERMIDRLDLRASVTLAGYVGQDDLADYYDEADIFCLPSFREGIPVVLMEAMARGVPVVASGIMGIPELVESGREGVLVPPGRADLLADAVARLARDPAERLRLGAQGRRKVSTEFNHARSAELLDAIFSSMLNEEGGGHRYVNGHISSELHG